MQFQSVVRNISTTTGWIAMKRCAEIHGALEIILSDFKVLVKSKLMFKCLYHICNAQYITYVPASDPTMTKK